MMKIQRTIPPAAAPLKPGDLVRGIGGLVRGNKSRGRIEQELKDYFGVKHVFLVSSGKAALTTILLALKSLSPGRRKVLIPAYTCYSVPSSIVKAGLDVSLCDMDPARYDYDYRLLPDAVSADTLCVLSGNLFGVPSDIDRITGLCREKGIFVVEDAAQAMGVRSQGRLVGTIGDAGFYSLGRGKNITCGSGGVIVTNSDAIAAAIDALYCGLVEPNFRENVAELVKAVLLALFIRPSLYWLPAGLPFLKLGETLFYRDFPMKRLSGMKAGLLANWRRRLEEYNLARKENAEYYCTNLSLGPRPGLSAAQASLRFPIVVASRGMRDGIVEGLSKLGLGVGRMYPSPVNMIEEIRNEFQGQEYPSAQRLSERLFTVPLHPLVGTKERRAICELLNRLANSTEFMKEQPGDKREWTIFPWM